MKASFLPGRKFPACGGRRSNSRTWGRSALAQRTGEAGRESRSAEPMPNGLQARTTLAAVCPVRTTLFGAYEADCKVLRRRDSQLGHRLSRRVPGHS